MLLSMDSIPELPIDPSTLSRDPKVGEAYVNDPLVWHPLGRLFGMGLELYRRGWVPAPLVAALSLPYFERTLA